MERRVLIAIILSFAVLYGYQRFVVPPPPAETAAQSGQAATGSQNAQGRQSGAPGQSPATGTAAVDPAAQAAAVTPFDGEATEREIVVETQVVQAVLTSRGGRLLHWRLKAYTDEAGTPVDLVPSNVPADQPVPFSLAIDGDQALSSRLNTAVYQVTGATGNTVDATAQPATIVFEGRDAAGLVVRKAFGFDPKAYVVSFDASVTSGGQALNPTVLWGPGLGDIGATAGGGSFFTGNAVQAPQAIYHLDGKVQRVAAGKLGEQGRPSGGFRFAGIDDHYFLAAALAPGTTQASFGSLLLNGEGDSQRQLVTQAFRFSAPPSGVKFFVGPKQFDILKATDLELVKAINFGMFAWLVLPLLSALKWIYGFVGNYGWSIILLTVVINLVLFPLRHKSVVSMRKMQALQPHIKSIQERYGDLKVTDPARQKMQTEIMNLYRERGVNPASGCVPMLLTMPVLFAFYSMLSQAIELRGADFGLWIHDLSAHDPYYVTPLLMGASMFWQQKITPSTADPAQQKVMMFMPLMFTAMFIRFPSGLAIYYFTSNLWTIGQQYFTNWLIGPLNVQPVRPAAERRLKKAGSGKTAAAERQD